jgi:hypothetical protein
MQSYLPPPPPLDPVAPLPPDPIPEPDPIEPEPVLEPDEPVPPLELPDLLPDCPCLPEPSMRSPGLIFPDDSCCDMPDEPEPLDPAPLPSVTLGGVPPLDCCAFEGSPVKAINAPVARATVNTCAVFM